MDSVPGSLLTVETMVGFMQLLLISASHEEMLTGEDLGSLSIQRLLIAAAS